MRFRDKALLTAQLCVSLGVIETCTLLARYYLYDGDCNKFDKKYSTETTTRMSIMDVEISNLGSRNYAHGYRTAPEQFIRNLISQLDIDYREYDFVDIGCGKGRVLLVASNYPFRSISGIDASRRVLDIAKCNLEIYKCAAQKCFNIQVYEKDALEFEPPVASTVYYFFEPFDTYILCAILARLSSALKGQGKQIFVICVWRDLESTLPSIEKLGFFMIRHQKMLPGNFNYTVFSLGEIAQAKQIPAHHPNPFQKRQGGTIDES
jgi:SAM-dependent methyltransferase